MRTALIAALTLSLAAAAAAGTTGLLAGENEAAGADFPHQGESLRKIDWTKFFPAGDGWRKSKQVFVYSNMAEPKTLDPGVMTGNPEHTLAMQIYEGLTILHPETLQPLPGAAEWWEISPDGLTYTFHLHPDMKWSNGDPFTAEDFRWSWERALSPALASQYADILYSIEGSEAFNKGETKDFAKVGVTVVDPSTLRVRLRAPTPYFLELTSFETLMPVHRATVEKWGTDWTKPEHIVSNGAFKLDAWRPKDAIELVPNPNWWNRKIVRLERIVAKPLDDVDTEMQEYKSGGLDWIREVPALRVEEAQADPDYFVTPYMTTWFMRINVTKKPFDDVRVRKAFNLAINKKEVCEKTLKAGQMPAMGAVPPGIHGYPQLDGLAYDPKTARKLLAEAGYPDGKGFPEVELLYNVHESHKVVCEAISSMWREVLGVRVRLQQREWQAYLEDQKNLNYQIARAGWIGDYADPNTFLDMWCKDRGNNETGWSSEEYDKLLIDAAHEQDPAKRLALLQKAERILCVDALPILPVYYYVNQGMIRPSVKGWYANLRDLHPLQFVWIDGPSATDRAGK